MGNMKINDIKLGNVKMDDINLSNVKMDDKIEKEQSLAQISGGIFAACLVFAVPLAVVYNFFYYKWQSTTGMIVIFFSILLLAFITNLMFYRIVVANDVEMSINKMSINDIKIIFLNTAASMVIVAITFMGLSVNPNLVKVFENTFGYAFIKMLGVSDFYNNLFSSKMFTDIKTNGFDYGFLITCLSMENIDEFINSIKDSNPINLKSNNEDIRSKQPMALKQMESILGDLKFDFSINYDFLNEVNRIKLRNFVKTKNTVGHYIWGYISSVIVLIISMIGCIMLV